MNLPVATWLLPVKNGMPFLRETMASLAAQVRTDAEVLAWDNGSTDDSVTELHAWIPNRLPGRVVTDQPRPLAAALAAMVEASRSPYCARIDADDLAAPDRLAQQIYHLEAHPRAAAVGSLYQAIDETGRCIEHTYEVGRDYSGIQDILLRHNAVLHPGVTFRRESILALGSYQRPSPVEDYDLWLRLCVRHEFHCLPGKLTSYRVHRKSVTGRIDDHALWAELDDCWITNAPDFAGLSNESATRIRRRTCRCLLPHLITISRRLGRRDSIGAFARFCRPEFLRSALFLCSPGDRATRRALRACQRMLAHC